MPTARKKPAKKYKLVLIPKANWNLHAPDLSQYETWEVSRGSDVEKIKRKFKKSTM